MPIPQVTVADEPTWPEVTAWSTSVILPPSGFPIPMVTVADDEPSEATATAAAAVTEDSTDATTVIVETDEAWEAKLLEDMKVASMKRTQHKENKKRCGKKRCPPCAMM
ncbi:uncharacterized protein J4E84_007284 [Alternaria hordeiaustralica]|uniref:uncharacterized protein n=1 Tax=Alternaria hordeiaustralica TaxID=1187925 RepID=UPI0020C3B4F3|nr:uncharacterized protein J4E84_007284 [Alternaria hordeiaustralica]KAI4682819.1 hypothetical protein J4E84_007284 [Alternaria hordeiaustralica]